jgi:hypothetical protein
LLLTPERRAKWEKNSPTEWVHLEVGPDGGLMETKSSSS